MARKITYNYICPFCNRDVYVQSSIKTNVAYSQTKRGTKQYFHRYCFEQNTIGAKRRRENSNG